MKHFGDNIKEAWAQNKRQGSLLKSSIHPILIYFSGNNKNVYTLLCHELSKHAYP